MPANLVARLEDFVTSSMARYKKSRNLPQPGAEESGQDPGKENPHRKHWQIQGERRMNVAHYSLAELAKHLAWPRFSARALTFPPKGAC